MRIAAKVTRAFRVDQVQMVDLIEQEDALGVQMIGGDTFRVYGEDAAKLESALMRFNGGYRRLLKN